MLYTAFIGLLVAAILLVVAFVVVVDAMHKSLETLLDENARLKSQVSRFKDLLSGVSDVG